MDYGPRMQPSRLAALVETSSGTLTSAADGTLAGTITLPGPAHVCQVDVLPGTGDAAPTAFTTLTVTDANGIDLFDGEAAGMTVANTRFVLNPPQWVPSATLTVAGTGLGDSNTVEVKVYTA